MVAARRRPIVPRIILAPALPLAGNPPAADLDGPRWVGKVEDHDDIADVTLCGRRDVGVTPIEIEAVHTTTDGAPFANKLWVGRFRYIVNIDSAARLVRQGFAELLLINHHDAAGDPDLVRVPAFADRNCGKDARCARVGDVDDGRTGRRPHMTDKKRSPLNPDLAAARTFDVGQQLGI